VMSGSDRSGQQKVTFCIGPVLSLVLALTHIIQLIVNDPTRTFSEEIISKLEGQEGRPLSYSSWTKYTEYHSGDRLLERTDGGVDDKKEFLFRPSILQYESITDDIYTSTVQGGKYPGESIVLTDYANDTIVSITNFIELDPVGGTVVPVNREENTAYVTCQFQDFQYSFFFPQFAQQIFRCWSFFRANKDKTPIFVASRQEYYWNLAMDERYNQGLVSVMEYAGIQVLNASDTQWSTRLDEQSISGYSRGPILPPQGAHFQMASIDDMASFRETTLASQGFSTIPTSFCGHPSNFPRIAILSRRITRRIKDVLEIAAGLQQHYNLTRRIPVIYFEGASFRSQAAAMSSIDILITSHGAQETGVAFMPKCGGVLELLPESYFVPRFYGTLASSAGIVHAYIYLARNVSDETVDVKLRDVGFLYPSFGKIQEGVDLLLQRWHRCCNGLRQEEGINEA